MTTIDKVIDDIYLLARQGDFTAEDYRKLSQTLINVRTQLSNRTARSVQAGDRVKFTAKRLGTLKGTVIKVKRTKASVYTQTGVTYDVPFSMLESA